MIHRLTEDGESWTVFIEDGESLSVFSAKLIFYKYLTVIFTS